MYIDYCNVFTYLVPLLLRLLYILLFNDISMCKYVYQIKSGCFNIELYDFRNV